MNTQLSVNIEANQEFSNSLFKNWLNMELNTDKRKLEVLHEAVQVFAPNTHRAITHDCAIPFPIAFKSLKPIDRARLCAITNSPGANHNKSENASLHAQKLSKWLVSFVVPSANAPHGEEIIFPISKDNLARTEKQVLRLHLESIAAARRRLDEMQSESKLGKELSILNECLHHMPPINYRIGDQHFHSLQSWKNGVLKTKKSRGLLERLCSRPVTNWSDTDVEFADSCLLLFYAGRHTRLEANE